MAKKVKLFVPYKSYTRDDGVKVTKYKINPELEGKVEVTIKAIDINSGRVDYRPILEYSKHENIKLYKIESLYFDTFWASYDHSLIAYDSRLDCIRKVSPEEIIAEKDRYYFIKQSKNADIINLDEHLPPEVLASDVYKTLYEQNCILIPAKFVKITYDPTITTAYDLTVKDYYTFATHDGVFVQDTVGLYFINTKDAVEEIFTNKMHTIYHIKYLQNDKYIHVFRHEMLYALYLLSSTESEDKSIYKEVDSIKDYEIDFEDLNNIGRYVYIKDIDKTTTLGKLILNKVLFDDAYLLDVTVTKKKAQLVNDLIYNKLKKENPSLDEYNLNKKYLDKLHEVMLFLADFISYTQHVPSIRKDDYKVYDEILDTVKKLPNEPHIGKVVYEQVVDDTLDKMKDDESDLYKIYLSGARASKTQISQIMVARGYLADDKNRVLKTPIRSNLLQGLTEDELFVSSFGARKGLIDKHEETPKSGYLSRAMMMNTSMVTSDLNCDDCGTDRYLEVKLISKDHAYSLIDRYYLDEKTGQLVKITKEIADKLYNEYYGTNKHIKIRSPIFCKHTHFRVCRKCSGDFQYRMLGLLSGSFIAERMTQLILRTFHTSGAAIFDIPEELYELVDESLIIDPTHLDPKQADKIDEINKVFKYKINNDNYEVYIEPTTGEIKVKGTLINKDIVTAVNTIRSFLTKSIDKIAAHGLYPQTVYHAIMKEYLKHGFIKSLYIETVLSILFVQQNKELDKVPIRYVDEIDWNQVSKLSIKLAGREFGRFVYLIFEPNVNSLLDIVRRADKAYITDDVYYRLLSLE